ncbi:MAG: hypothetical protein E6344_19620 [Clostridium sp.]|uniref:hypothetical protein n=1 Tax=Clostridium sp. TaxID=1506 RepID=UPI0028FF1632|nr:hypothetical protein [Clostridium sp.]MDU2156543.1 hypothetical protein [Clostridium sp.]MDU7085899.1 hypothetical protein [Clostridium sp.]
MGKQMQDIFDKFEALELAKEVEKAKEDMSKQLNVNAATRLIAEQYKKSCSQPASKRNNDTKTTNLSIADEDYIGNSIENIRSL